MNKSSPAEKVPNTPLNGSLLTKNKPSLSQKRPDLTKTNPKLGKAKMYKNSQFSGVTKKHKQPLDDIMTEPDLAILLGCTEETLWTYRRDLALPYIKVGRDVYYSQRRVYKWLLSREQVNNNGNNKGGEKDG